MLGQTDLPAVGSHFRRQRPQAGWTSPRSEQFRNLAPLGSNLDASALVYDNMGSMPGSPAAQIEGVVEPAPIRGQAVLSALAGLEGISSLLARPGVKRAK